jgi:hypothetical protein
MLTLGAIALPFSAHSQTNEYAFAASKWAVVARESGPVNYFTVMQEGGQAFVRADYKPPMKTVVLGVEVPKEFQHGAHKLRWKWRARTLPNGGNECERGKADSAADVYVIWKSGLKYYTLKYVWSSVGPKGAVCDSRRGWFSQQDTIIRQSGGPLNTWVTEEIDPTADFLKHFRDNDPNGNVPELVGLGIMSDGDQTSSESSADYADFILGH